MPGLAMKIGATNSCAVKLHAFYTDGLGRDVEEE